MSRYVQGTVVANRHWTEQLYSLQVEAEIRTFQAGQFGRLALDIDDQRVGRPYSFVNAPDESPLEFYSIIVPEGQLSSRLHQLQPGDPVWVSPRAAGFFTLSQVPDGNDLWLLSTGTAIGPFLSILKTDEPWQRFAKIILVHAVRTASELSYRDTINTFAECHPDQFTMIPFVSREETDSAIKGRIPATIEDGRLEERGQQQLSCEYSQVMICGNPAMVVDTTEMLTARGFKKNKRKDPGNITTENYW
jgi:ferredoxin--NADP+ reductase